MTYTPRHSKTLSNHIALSKSHANRKWQRAALAAVKRLARKRRTFTTADVLAELQKSQQKTHDLRAIGPVMVDARVAGIVVSNGLVRRNDCHSRGATTLWRSAIYADRFPAPSPTSDPSTIRPDNL